MRARALVLFSGICFATTGTTQELGPDSAPTLGVAAARLIVGALTLLAFTLVRTSRSIETTRPNVPQVQLWIAGGAMAMYGATFFAAVRSTGVAVGTVVALGSAPIFTGLVGYSLHVVTPRRSWILSTLGCILGITLMVVRTTNSGVTAMGVALALGSGLGYSIFALASKKILSTGVGPEWAMSRVFLISALMMSPVLLFIDNSWIFTASGITMALWLGVVTIAIGYIAYSLGLRSMQPNEATTLTLIEPVIATLLGALVLAERPSQIAWVGMVIVILSLSFAS